MNGSQSWQWSLRSMFGLLSASAIMAFWMRLRLAIDPSWTAWLWISIPEGLALGCLGFWLAQCCLCPRFSEPRCEILAIALLLSAFETVRGILNGYWGISGPRGQRLTGLIQTINNINAILEYGFVLSCALAVILAVPKARESVARAWFIVLVLVVSTNIGVLIWFCNWFGTMAGIVPR